MGNDKIGERMKDQYEDRTRISLPRRTYTVIRLDGKAFHTFTKGFKRPYDLDLMNMMDETAKELCKQIQGVKMAYVQSDEISLILTDFETPTTDAWFDGNIQKMVSVAASIATAAFNNEISKLQLIRATDGKGQSELIQKNGLLKQAYFDARVFTIPDVNEVFNYLIWRQQDATRNSIQMGAQNLYSQKQLDGKNTSELQELMFQKGINWNDYPVGFKRGRVIQKETYLVSGQTGFKESQIYTSQGEIKTVVESMDCMVKRTRWASTEPPIFSQDKKFLKDLIPNIGDFRDE